LDPRGGNRRSRRTSSSRNPLLCRTCVSTAETSIGWKDARRSRAATSWCAPTRMGNRWQTARRLLRVSAILKTAALCTIRDAVEYMTATGEAATGPPTLATSRQAHSLKIRRDGRQPVPRTRPLHGRQARRVEGPGKMKAPDWPRLSKKAKEFDLGMDIA
jgi:hypothetical protein